MDDSSDAGSKDIQNGDDAAVGDDDDGYDDFVIIGTGVGIELGFFFFNVTGIAE